MGLREEMLNLISQVNLLISVNNELQQENNILSNRNEELENENNELQQESNMLSNRNEELENENNELKREKEEIEDENNELKREKEEIEDMIKELEDLMSFLNPPVQVNGMGYNTIQEAINFSFNGDVIKLNEDMNVEETIIVDKEITLDLNGKTIANNENIFYNSEDKKNWSLISVREGGKLTITGNGVVEAKEGDCYAIDLYGGNCVIENGKFVGNTTTVYAHTGYLVVKDGDFSLKQLADGVVDDRHRYMLNCLDINYRNSNANITVEGGTFKNFNPQNNLAEGKGTNFVVEGYEVVEVESNIYKVVKK
jgi:hypothetical protein